MKTSKLIFTILLSIFIIMLVFIIIMLIIQIRHNQKKLREQKNHKKINKNTPAPNIIDSKKSVSNIREANANKVNASDPVPTPFDFYTEIVGFIPQFSEKFSSIAAKNIGDTLTINKDKYKLFENLFANIYTGNRKNVFSALLTYFGSHNYTPTPNIQIVKFLNTDAISFYLPKTITDSDGKVEYTNNYNSHFYKLKNFIN